MSNNNQPNRSYPHSSNQSYQSRRPYAQPQPANQPNQPNQNSINNHQYHPNNQTPYGNPNDLQRNYGNNYYYPYPYGHYNPHQSQHYAPPPHMYMQPPHYAQNYQQIPQNMSHLAYNRPPNPYSQQSQSSKYNQPQQKTQQYSQSNNQRGPQMTPNKREYAPKHKIQGDFSKSQEKQGYYSNKTPTKKQYDLNQEGQDRDIQINSYQSASESQEEQEQIFYKKKQIQKKKDPVLDSKEEIRKWIQARKRNYPRRNVTEQEREKKSQQEELSILQKKIRKKIVLINSDPKSILKKQKDLDILRRFMLYPRRPRKQPKFVYQRKQAGPLIQQVIEAEPKQIKPQTQLLVQKIPQEQQEIVENNQELKENEGNDQDEIVQLPIKSNNNAIAPVEKQQRNNEGGRNKREQLSVDVIIKHLQMKQKEDSKMLSNLMDYKTNSFNYRYQHQTLETNLLLQNIFRDTSYMLQAIRYIVKNNFFD